MRTVVACAALALTLLAGAPIAVTPDQANRPSPSRTADEQVATKVQTQRFADPPIKVLAIRLTTFNGIVTLSGGVPDLSARTRSERLSRATREVADVRNELRVRR